ncbi:hypothetical protein AB0952_08690 [Streptomyces caniferus]|uniref:hypothetical protein n=1 Tax=Streptomyces caniferus TaxID=285557 RepID=UPI0034545402
MIAGLRTALTQVTRHHGFRDLSGAPAPAAEAWDHFDNGPARRYWPLLRELDPRAGVYEIRVSGELRYELRRAAPASGHRIDVVVDRDPDNETDVTVYVNGVKTTGPDVQIHVLDPGRAGADHEWLNDHLQHDDSVPVAVRSEIALLAQSYHHSRNCAHPDCDG